MCICSTMTPTENLAHNAGLCPDFKWTTLSQAGTQSTEPHQPGLNMFKLEKIFPCIKIPQSDYHFINLSLRTTLLLVWSQVGPYREEPGGLSYNPNS